MSNETVTVPRRLIEELAQYLAASERPTDQDQPPPPGTTDADLMASAPLPTRPGQIKALVDAARNLAYADADTADSPSATQAGEGGEFKFCRPKPQ